eukprot:15459147-Alexandrium_andersonii.AAC.1
MRIKKRSPKGAIRIFRPAAPLLACLPPCVLAGLPACLAAPRCEHTHAHTRTRARVSSYHAPTRNSQTPIRPQSAH